MNILMIDNFDSFTHNLVDEFEKLNCIVHVYRNNMGIENFDKIVLTIKPILIVISPGPGTPQQAGISIEIIKNYSGKIPIFGVCLGHQCIIEAFNGIVDSAHEIRHGKSSNVIHDKKTIFKNIENPFRAGRYHSLAAKQIPSVLEVSAMSDNNIVMGVRHKSYLVEGVQFHPESILTPNGPLIINNLLSEIKNQKNSSLDDQELPLLK
jgi:anthranilate synthase/aminodeoxychorismate synthase-like glutamine amidotransferase